MFALQYLLCCLLILPFTSANLDKERCVLLQNVSFYNNYSIILFWFGQILFIFRLFFVFSIPLCFYSIIKI